MVVVVGGGGGGEIAVGNENEAAVSVYFVDELTVLVVVGYTIDLLGNVSLPEE